MRKRNIELARQIEDAKRQLENVAHDKERVNDLIERLERIEIKWSQALDDLNKKKQRYDELINDLEKAKKIMVDMGFIPSWHQKIINRNIFKHKE